MEEIVLKENVQKKILIISREKHPSIQYLATFLKKYDYHLFFSTRAPNEIHSFHRIFSFDDQSLIQFVKERTTPPVTLIITKNKKNAQKALSQIKSAPGKNIKVIYAPQKEIISTELIEKIVWFSLSHSKERYLTLETHIPHQLHRKIHAAPKIKKYRPSFIASILFFTERYFKIRSAVLLIILFLFIYHTLFIPFLAYGSFLTYRTAQYIKNGSLENAFLTSDQAKTVLEFGYKVYSFSRPTYLLFSFARIPDDIFSINNQTHLLLATAKTLKTQTSDLFNLIMMKNKTEEKQRETLMTLQKVKSTVDTCEEQMIFLQQKLPENSSKLKLVKQSLSEFLTTVSKFKKIYPFLTDILAQSGNKKYLLLFANNMELRPGGGFIGSFGLLHMKNLSISEFSIYDVYDADGQLKAHVDPPAPIRNHLDQPHWFLRDSAFSPNHYENHNNALFFLEKEMGISDIDGSILITTTAVKYILEAFDSVYIPDFQEKITKDNFYLKTQLYAEKEFFPGSIQKKGFLSALGRQIFLNLENVAPERFFKGILQSLEEKQIVLYTNSSELQKRIDDLYWSGKIIEPSCPPDTTNCYTDFLFPFDANLGINKANFFVFRSMHTEVSINSEGFINTALTIQYKNTAQRDVFPGGAYKNYFQLLLPRSSVLESIAIDSIPVTTYDTELAQFKKLGLLIEVQPQKTTELRISYRSILKFNKGRSIYQLLFQKQIGSMNNDFDLKITLPKNMYMVNQNFSPLVKQNQILYNTDLSTDKIFFIELLKE